MPMASSNCMKREYALLSFLCVCRTLGRTQTPGVQQMMTQPLSSASLHQQDARLLVDLQSLSYQYLVCCKDQFLSAFAFHPQMI